MRRWVVLLLMVSLHACATVGRSQQSEALALEEARVKARKDQWHITWQQYMDDARVVTTQASLLQGHPGWSDMQRILQTRESIRFLEGEKMAHTKTSMALAEWDRKWTASSNEMLRIYISLVDFSRELDDQRKRLERGRREIYIQEANILTLKLQNNLISSESGRVIRESLNTMYEADLSKVNFFQLNNMSLYQSASHY
ncbi:MAG: hypothetical protein ACRERE_29345 [Candidatus Entotheonellia bacterium]